MFDGAGRRRTEVSLATRCTSCHTVFRVVQDQLKVSEGWVRCGRCHEVFNALESLFDLEPAALAASVQADAAAPAATPPPDLAEAPAAEPPGAVAPEAPLPASTDAPAPPPGALALPSPASPFQATPFPATPAASEPAPPPAAEAAVEPDTRPEPSRVAAPPAWPAPAVGDTARSGRGAAEDTPASRLAARDRVEFEDARFNSELFADEGIGPAADGAEDPAAPQHEGAAAPGPGDAGETPEFLRRAEQHARWSQPVVVVALVLLCGVLLLGLAAQVAYHFRDLAAATYPQARPVLSALCEMAGCRIEPLHRIDDIVIESSALTGAPTGDAVRLSVVLRNRGALPLAMPAIELALTDVGGQMLARRALLPADFGQAGATLPAAAETPLHLVLAVDGRRPSGYTVEPFYP